MPTAVETICVDIGNSGLRCVRLVDRTSGRWPKRVECGPRESASYDSGLPDSGVPASGHSANALPWEGDVLRISWPLGNNPPAVAETPGESEHARAYLLQSLEPWLGLSASAAGRTVPRRWVVSSVQRTIAAHLRACAERMGASQFQLVTHTDLDLQVAVDHPEQVGIDRLLAATAALQHSPAEHLIVIQAGSAITVDWAERPNRFRGGAIMPGVPMMLRLLSRGADLLPSVAAGELLDLPPLPGTNTIAAMTAGVSSAVVGGVQHLISRYRSQLGAATPVVLSGGDGPRLAPHLGSDVIIVDHLVLRGLAQIASQLACAPGR